MFNKSIVVMFSGRAGVGKTTCSKLLKGYDQDIKSEIASMAFGLKFLARSFFGWDGNKDDKGRKLLQDLGRVGRDYNEDFWVDYTFSKHLPEKSGFPFDLILVDDWRFPNEYTYLTKQRLYHPYRVRIIAPERELLKGTDLYNDISETALTDKDEYDFYINNSGSMDSLKTSLVAIYNYILRKHSFGGK